MSAFANTDLDTWMIITDGLIMKHGVTDGFAVLRGIVHKLYNGTDEEYNTIMEAWEAREDAFGDVIGGCGIIDCEMC